MNLTLSFFKKTFITGAALALLFSSGLALFTNANAIQNNQNSPNGAGIALQLSTNKGQLTKVSTASTPKHFLCLNKTKPTFICRCQNEQNAFCKCLKDGQAFCTRCEPNQPSVCWICPTNPKMMIACRINDGENQNIPGVATTSTGSVESSNSNVIGSQGYLGPPVSTGNNSNPGTEPIDSGSSTQPSPEPGFWCPPESSRLMGVACRGPGLVDWEQTGPASTGCGGARMCIAQ